MGVDDGLWRVDLQSGDTRVLGSQAVAVLVQVRVVFLGAAVVDGGGGAGWLVGGHDRLTVHGGAEVMVVGVIVEVRGSQLRHYTAILHYGFSRQTFRKKVTFN